MTEAEWLASEDPAAILSHLSKPSRETRAAYGVSTISDRKLRLFAVACCRRCEQGGASPLEWSRWLEALACAEEVADGKQPASRLSEYGRHCWAAWEGSADRAAALSVRFMREACEDVASQNEESQAQAHLLRDIVGNPFRPVVLQCCPKCQRMKRTATRQEFGPCQTCHGVGGVAPWLTPTVLSLAHAAYDDRDPATGHLDPVKLTILADALEEAGCPQVEEECPACKGAGELGTLGGKLPCYKCATDYPKRGTGKFWAPHPLLAHLRSPGPHVRGCWAVDAVLGLS